AQMDDQYARITIGQGVEGGRRAVRAAIIDEYDLVAAHGCVAARGDFLVQLRERLDLVVDGHEHRELGAVSDRLHGRADDSTEGARIGERGARRARLPLPPGEG